MKRGISVLPFFLVLTSEAAVRAPAFLQEIPLRFEENRGQAQAPVRYVAHGQNYSMALSPGAGRLTWTDPVSHRSAELRMRFLGAAAGTRLESAEPLPVRSSYFRGADPSKWLAGIPAYGRVNYREIYRGVDLTFYGSHGTLECDFVLRPGADPGAIRLALEGALRMRFDAAGNLLLSTEAGEVRWERPVVYQTVNGVRHAVDGHFRRIGKRTIAFALGAYDRRRDLVIDPVLSFATYLSGTGNEAARGVAVDSAGNMYIAGYTTSQDLPVTKGAMQTTYGGETANFMTGDAFVAKFSPAGTPVYITYLGGRGDDVALGIAVDASGNAWITGYTNSDSGQSFPLKNAFQSAYGGAGGNARLITGDAFVAGLDPTGTRLLYSSYLGGRQDDCGTAIAVDSSGNVFVTGTTLSRDFPTSQGPLQTNHGGGREPTLPAGFQAYVAGDAFVVKLTPGNAPGSQLQYGALVGGQYDDVPLAIAVDGEGFAFIAGYTLSPDFPVTPGAFQTTFGGQDTKNNLFFWLGDGFVAKLNATGTQLLAATYLGAEGDDGISALALDSSANVYVTGSTTSVHFPLTQGILQSRNKGPSSTSYDQLLGDAFVAKLKADLSGLVFSTYLGGEGDDAGGAIAVDAGGNVYVAGQTNSKTFPVSADAAQKTFAGAGLQNQRQPLGDGFLVQLSAAGDALVYGTYLGGSGDDVIAGMAVDKAGNAYVAGSTVSRDFPVTAGAFQVTYQAVNASAQGRVHGHTFAARYSGFSTTAASPISLVAIANAASYARGIVSPGMVFAAFGSGLGPNAGASGTFDATGKLLNNSINGVRILFNNYPAPLLYASEGQVNGVVPYEIAGQTTVQVVAQYGGQQSGAITVNVPPSVPGLVALNGSGTGQGAILNQDGSVNSATNPAHPGEIIVLYGTGEGQTDVPGVDGLVNASPYAKPLLPVSVSIGGANAEIRYFAAAPGFVAGVFQVNAIIPLTVTGGNQPVTVTVGNAKSQANLTVAVQP